MKKLNFLALAAMATTVFTACSNDEDGVNQEKRVEARFVSGISGAVTKAVDASWESGDNIGIFMKTAGAELATANILEGVDNLQYTTTGTTGAVPFTPVGTAAYFPTDENVDFIAYYPYQATITNYIYPVNLTNQTSQPDIDLLYSNNATGLNDDTPTVALMFTHQLTKLVFNVEPGTGLTEAELAGLTVSIQGMNTTADFNLATGTITNPGTPAAIVAATAADGVSSEAIVFPADVSTNNIVFTLSNNDSFTWTIPAATTYDAGTKVTYTVTINRTGVTVTGEITDWTPVDGGNIVAE